MNLQQQIDALREDRPVVEAFAHLLLRRLREKHPGMDIRLGDISLRVEVSEMAPVHRLISDMIAEGVSV